MENGNEKRVWVIVAVLAVLLTAGGAWWWKGRLDGKGAAPAGSAATATEAGSAGGVSEADAPTPAPVQDPDRTSPEALSRTDFSLPGDAILEVRSLGAKHRTLEIEIHYRANSQHGDRIMIGAWLDIPSRYTPIGVPGTGEGTVKFPITIMRAGESREMRIFMYESGKPGQPFAVRTMPFSMNFE